MKRIAPHLFLAVVLTATAWLIFCAVMIGTKTLFPRDNLISIRVSDGAQISVQNSVPTLRSPGIMYIDGAYHPILIPFLAVPFGVIVWFAILGCRSLRHSHRPAAG